MWASVLLFCAQFALGVTGKTLFRRNCPTNCSCYHMSGLDTRINIGNMAVYFSNIMIEVNCHGRADIDRETLLQQLDSLLSSNVTKGRLTWLSIANTPLKRVPPSICQLTKLEFLYLNRSQLTRLPDNCFSNLKNLRIFSAPENMIENLQDGVFIGLTKLMYINLGRNNISFIGTSVCGLRALKVLAVDHNRLTRLPDNCFANLTNLKLFLASDNAIEALQDGVFDGLTKLQSLNLKRNRITTTGLSICRLTSLTNLLLHHNRLTRLPNCFSHLSNLVRFWASYNAIETLQDGVFNGMAKLQLLELHTNSISSIGSSVFAKSSNLSSLFYIDLSWNNLTSLEPWVYDRGLIGDPARRVFIYLLNNKISQFTNNMGHNGLCQNKPPYVFVYLQYNKIKHLTDIFSGWQQDIKQLSSCYYDLVVNMLIETDGNDVRCDCVNYHFYREVKRQRLRSAWGTATCNLTDPLTKKSIVVSGYDLDPGLFVCELTERCPAGCICVRRPANFTLHVYCSNTNLTVLPPELPELPDSHTKYKLDFSNNRFLRHLEHRSYFVNTSVLDASNSGVNDITDWEKITTVQDLNLYGNKLTSLPRSLKSVNITGMLNFANNPWDCSCDNKWMSEWLIYTADQLKSAEEVRCNSPSRLRGKKIIDISQEEFCVDPASEAASEATNKAVRRTLTISVSSFAGVIILVLSSAIIVYRLRVKLYTRWKFHPFDRDECLGEKMDYDVFLSCSSLDDEPHGMCVLKLIESKGYRVCYHERDFLPGELISDNIGHGIERSKRTVCLLSENFMRSAFCMHEFQFAFHHNIIEKRKKRLIVLMMLDNPNDLLTNDDSSTAVLRQFLRQYTYIDYTVDDWLDRLLYALPLHGLLQQNEDPDPDIPLLHI